jgi:hypothetical protein
MNNESPEITTYQNREELLRELRRRKYSPAWIREQLKHEDEHMRKALQLGYKPRYCLGITEDLGFEKSHKIGIGLDRPASEEDLRVMLSAPRKLSISDKAHLALLKIKGKKGMLVFGKIGGKRDKVKKPDSI